MIHGPEYYFTKFFEQFKDLYQQYPPPLRFQPPLRERVNPFSEDDLVKPMEQPREYPPSEAVVTDVTISKRTKMRDLRASDYITPQKYLDGSEIPTYYSFQSAMITVEDMIHGMHPLMDVDRR